MVIPETEISPMEKILKNPKKCVKLLNQYEESAVEF